MLKFRARALFPLLASAAVMVPLSAAADPTYEIFPQQKKQTVLGLGVEIQSDSIGSGNHGLPEAPVAVPHDLVPAERERFATEMLKGFRYLRLAGGLYWRGLDAEGKYLRPRWPEQLLELKTLVDRAGIEGLSFEYWSPAPYWKANGSYVKRSEGDALNTLRPFAPNFAADPVYKGDRTRFFNDFAAAVVGDISTLEQAGLKVSMFGLQNEPWVSHTIYSTNAYANPDEYLATFAPVARAIRQHDPRITIFADTNHYFPKFIAPGMQDPAIASLVDAYAVHTVGENSSTVDEIDARIRKELPARPWFQNEYEYLTGGATPARTLNTVQHIMNSFQTAGNPTWMWLHALKPVGNSEASGYALGFWNSALAPAKPGTGSGRLRWHGGPELTDLPADLMRMEAVYGGSTEHNDAGSAYKILVDRPARVLLLVEENGGYQPKGWTDTGRTLRRKEGIDRIYARTVPAGEVDIPVHPGTAGHSSPPHAAFVEAVDGKPLDLQVGINTPAYIASQVSELSKLMRDVKPGHWVFNDLNWNAVGSFAKRMPWNSVVLDARASQEDDDARLLVFQKPDGKRTIVVSNRKTVPVTFTIDTNLQSRWRGHRFTPYERGADTQGVPAGSLAGEILKTEVAPLSWTFWDEE